MLSVSVENEDLFSVTIKFDLVITNNICEVTRSLELLVFEDIYHLAISIDLPRRKLRHKTLPQTNLNQQNFRKATFLILY